MAFSIPVTSHTTLNMPKSRTRTIELHASGRDDDDDGSEADDEESVVELENETGGDTNDGEGFEYPKGERVSNQCVRVTTNVVGAIGAFLLFFKGLVRGIIFILVITGVYFSCDVLGEAPPKCQRDTILFSSVMLMVFLTVEAAIEKCSERYHHSIDELFRLLLLSFAGILVYISLVTYNGCAVGEQPQSAPLVCNITYF